MIREILVLGSDVAPNHESVVGVISPAECIAEQEENGRYDLSLTLSPHAEMHRPEYQPCLFMTADGKYFCLSDGTPFAVGGEIAETESFEDCIPKGFDVLKIPIKYHGERKYQYFRVNRFDTLINAQALTAEHIFYDLRYKIMPENQADWKNSGLDIAGFGSSVFTQIMTYIMPASPAETRFSYSCDLDSIEYTGSYSQHNCIPLSAVLLDGADSFIERFGGFLYRDNFRFSINRTTEGSRKAPPVIYSANMTDINITEDWSDCITTVIAYDNYGHHTTIIKDISGTIFPRHIVRRIHIDYPEQLGDGYVKEMFDRDARHYLDEHFKPNISISVKVANIENDPRYADFINLAGYEVGDTVDIIHGKYGISFKDLRIIRKKYDVLREKTLEFDVGSFRRSFVRNDSYSGIITED